jgi:hypothetical protein
MENFCSKITNKKNEKFKQLKEIRDELAKPDLNSNVIKELLNKLLKFEDVTSKEINVKNH